MKMCKNIFYEYHDNFITSSFDGSTTLSDIKIICCDGAFFHSKLMIAVADPMLRNILMENALMYGQIILCPNITKADFIQFFLKSWQRISFYSSEEESKSSCQIASKGVISEQINGEPMKDYYQTASEGFEFIDKRQEKCQRKSCSNDFLCPSCGKSFLSDEKLRKHFYNVHHISKNSFECLICKKSFSSKEFLSKHKNQTHEEVINQCRMCHKTFQTIIEFNKHKRSHNQEEFKCQVCGKIDSKKSNHLRHLLTHNKVKAFQFQCVICERQFALKQHLERHQLSHQNNVTNVCPNCNRSFNRIENMKRHLLSCKMTDSYSKSKCAGVNTM